MRPEQVMNQELVLVPHLHTAVVLLLLHPSPPIARPGISITPCWMTIGSINFENLDDTLNRETIYNSIGVCRVRRSASIFNVWIVVNPAYCLPFTVRHSSALLR